MIVSIRIRLFFVFIIFSSLLFSQATAACTGYRDDVNMRVLDAKLRPIPGASVWIKYDRGTLAGEQYATTRTQYTNADGVYSFHLVNDGMTNRQIDCNIYISVSIGNQTNTTTITAKQHENIVDVVLGQVYPVQFYVRDQFRIPLSNSSLVLNANTTFTFKTDEAGIVNTFLRSGNYEYFVNYFEGSQYGAFSVNDDLLYEIELPRYKISIDMIDDFGAPLNSSLFIFNRTYYSDTGHFELPRVFGKDIPYAAGFSSNIKKGRIDPSTKQEIKIIFDLHPPVFKEVRAEDIPGSLRLIIPVSDTGPYASGLDDKNLQVSYKLDPGESTWSSATLFTVRKDVYVAEFPTLPPRKVISFRIRAQDKEGNKASLEGSFMSRDSTSMNQTNTSNTSQNLISPSQQKKDQNIPFFYIIISAIVLFLVIYLVFRLKSG